MKTRWLVTIAATISATALLSAQGPPPKLAESSLVAIAVIVNPSNPVENLSRAELRRIFMMETQNWPHARRITVVLGEKGQPGRGDAIRAICGISESEYDRHILLQTFRGTIGLGPRTIRTVDAMIRFVFNAPGAIGYAPASINITTTKVLRIDGLRPNDPDYPLRVRLAPQVRPPQLP